MFPVFIFIADIWQYDSEDRWIMKDASEGLLGHDVVEVLTADLATIGGCSLQHLLKFLDVHGLA
jgi:hypothetical protein